MQWFDVDKDGLRKVMARTGPAALVLELVQNAWDAPGSTTVDVTLTDHARRGRSTLAVIDDAPDGFIDLTHAFTLFAESHKKTDAQLRGRFNLGEKLLLAACDSATVTSTTGSVKFTEQGRSRSRTRTDRGTRIDATIQMTQAERREALQLLTTLIPPAGITTRINGVPLTAREPVREFTAALRTEIADEDGNLRPTTRTTTVRLHMPADGETPHVYEMGIPVVATDLGFHVDIAQRVPLSLTRDNLTPAYQRDLRIVVLNAAHDLLTGDAANAPWVREAAASDHAAPQAVTHVLTERFGDLSHVVAYDPSDPEANNRAVLDGYTVVHGGSLSKGEWAQARTAGAIRPAGQVMPTPAPTVGPGGVPPIAPQDYTPGMRHIVAYARQVGGELLGEPISVDVFSVANGFAAWYGAKTLSFNVRRLGHAWFDTPQQEAVDALLIHELAHDRVANHLSEDFHDECCRLGAQLRHVTVHLSDYLGR